MKKVPNTIKYGIILLWFSSLMGFLNPFLYEYYRKSFSLKYESILILIGVLAIVGLAITVFLSLQLTRGRAWVPVFLAVLCGWSMASTVFIYLRSPELWSSLYGSFNRILWSSIILGAHIASVLLFFLPASRPWFKKITDKPQAAIKTTENISTKARVLAFVLAVCLGMFGVHRFYLHRRVSGTIMLCLSAITIASCYFSLQYFASHPELDLTSSKELFSIVPLMIFCGSFFVIFYWWIIDCILVLAGFLSEKNNKAATQPKEVRNLKLL